MLKNCFRKICSLWAAEIFYSNLVITIIFSIIISVIVCLYIYLYSPLFLWEVKWRKIFLNVFQASILSRERTPSKTCQNHVAVCNFWVCNPKTGKTILSRFAMRVHVFFVTINYSNKVWKLLARMLFICVGSNRKEPPLFKNTWKQWFCQPWQSLRYKLSL